METVGLLLAASHVLFVMLILAWFGLNKPNNLKLARVRMKAAVTGKPFPRSDYR